MYVLESSSGDTITLYPEYNFQEKGQRMMAEHRTDAGKLYTYIYGRQRGWKFSVMYINSADRTMVNSWWADSRGLQFYPSSDTSDVSTVKLINKNEPINKLVKPYPDLYEGVIELSTY